jgi:hypothetical protein
MRRTLGFIAAAALTAMLVPLVFADDSSAPDRGKRVLEEPLERAITTGERDTGLPGFGENPRVTPGLIGWHADLSAARTAARESGRPVLLFQLLGRLDEEFC